MGVLDLRAGGFDVSGRADSGQHVIEVLAELRHPLRQLVQTLLQGRSCHRDRCIRLLGVGPRISRWCLRAACLPGVRAVVNWSATVVGPFAVAGRAASGRVWAAGTRTARVVAAVHGRHHGSALF